MKTLAALAAALLLSVTANAQQPITPDTPGIWGFAYEDLKQYPSYNELLADLGNGNVDGAFMDSLVMADQKEKGIYDLATAFTLAEADNFGFAFPKGSALRDEFNQFLLEHAAEVQAIIARHMKK